MKNLLIALPLCFLLNISSLIALADQPVASEVRPVATFHKIELASNIRADIITGKPQNISISTDNNQLANVVTEVEDDTLKISTAKKNFFHFFSEKNTAPVNIRISMDHLNKVESSGSNMINIQDQQHEKIKFDLSGTTTGRYEGNAECIKIETAGNTVYQLVGQTKQLIIDASGAGNINAAGLTAQKVKIEASGATAIQVKVIDSVNIEASGASTIEIFGNPKHMKQELSGAAKTILKQ